MVTFSWANVATLSSPTAKDGAPSPFLTLVLPREL